MLNYIETVPALTPWQTQSASIQAKHIPVFKGLFFGEGGGGGGGCSCFCRLCQWPAHRLNFQQ